MTRVKAVHAVGGPYPPTFEGISKAIVASFRDKKQAGRNESNSKMTLFFEDGTFEEVSLLDRMEHYKYVAASVCHQHEIEHDESICILWDELFKDGSLTDKERYPI